MDEEKVTYQISGRRLIEMAYFMEQLQGISNHKSMFNCNLSTIELLSEKRSGLHSTFSIKCKMCGAEFTLESSKKTENKMDVNEEIVAGIMTIGAGVTQLNTVLCHVNMPPMSVRLYQAKHDIISRWWKKAAQHYMIEAGKEEKDNALAIGSVNTDGLAMIPVSGDACWSKRSYGTNYSASSGVGAIVGMHSKKVLYYGVKNKFCNICARAENKGALPRKHACFKNFQGPSTAIEAVVITEGFKKSIGMHGLIYHQFIADGDSSTYASIRNARPYDDITVGKIECKNHLLRNYCKGLLAICSNTSFHIRGRKILKENYLRIRWGIDSSVKYWSNKNVAFEEKARGIKNDIINGPYHIFGDHSNCATYFCSDDVKKRNVNNMVPELTAYGVFQKVEDLAQRLSLHSCSFVYNETNNAVESFNARVAKFIGGKRVNFTQRGSYLARCAAAVVSYNTGVLQSAVHKYIFGTDANPEIVRLEKLRQNLNQKRHNRKIKKKKNPKPSASKDAYYGESCQKVDMNEEEFEEAKNKFLNALELSETEKVNLERDTVLQSGSTLWLETRRKLLTASWFAAVCKRRITTECGPLIKQILYQKDLSNIPSIKHGRSNEATAIRELAAILNMPIEKCGLFIDREFPFLGATPDGKCEIGIIEIKCPSSAYGLEPDDAIKLKKVDFWLPSDNLFTVNKKHKWYYQIQGQLRITRQDTCVFAIWTGPGKVKYEYIQRDEQFWKEKMEINLISFYQNCLLPELIDPRMSRNMKLRVHSSHLKKNILGLKNL